MSKYHPGPGSVVHDCNFRNCSMLLPVSPNREVPYAILCALLFPVLMFYLVLCSISVLVESVATGSFIQCILVRSIVCEKRYVV